MLLPEALLDEIVVTVRSHQHLRARITAEDLEVFARLISREAEGISKIEDPIPPVTRDREDDYLIAYALVGRADYLVSGDKDLLVLDPLGDLRIVDPAAFLQVIEG